MYSSDPKNPEKRIAEFKTSSTKSTNVGMGAILDVVYNHTAKVDIFEDLEPNYYHLWMPMEHLELALVVDVWGQLTI